MTKFAFAISDGKFGKFAAKHIVMRGELDESNVDKHAETMYEAIRLVPDGTYFVFDAKDRIDLKKYGWSGNNEDDIPKQAAMF